MNTYFEVNLYIPDFGYTTMYACDTRKEAEAYIKAHPCKDDEKYAIIETECDTDDTDDTDEDDY